jgi:hypothetical protein
VDGNNTLIIDGAIIHNTHNYEIIVRDSGNLTIINGAMAISEYDGISDEFRVSCEDQSVVRISNATVGQLSTRNEGGNILIESGSIIDRLRATSKSGGIKPTIRDSTI